MLESEPNKLQENSLKDLGDPHQLSPKCVLWPRRPVQEVEIVRVLSQKWQGASTTGFYMLLYSVISDSLYRNQKMSSNTLRLDSEG